MHAIDHDIDERFRRGHGVEPDSVILKYESVSYRIDLRLCRRKLVELRARREVANRAGLAKRAGVSRSTLSRFFHGHPVSLKVLHGILTALDLTFSDVVSVVTTSETNEAV